MKINMFEFKLKAFLVALFIFFTAVGFLHRVFS